MSHLSKCHPPLNKGEDIVRTIGNDRLIRVFGVCLVAI
nr:MAG TPA: hypothetical protein [Caudoviricetes sp.]